MTKLAFPGKCPTCGYEFQSATLMTGKPIVEGSNGICCMCGEIFRIEKDHTIRVLTAREYLHLHPVDAGNIALATVQITERHRREAARNN